jgi:hypothetical protein
MAVRTAAPDMPALDALGPPVEAPSTRTGASLFVVEGCGTCHVTVGPSTALQPTLAGAEARAGARLEAADYTGQADSPRDYIRESIVDHCIDTIPGYSCEGAPDVSVRLGTAEIEALVDFVMGLQ